jgi:hypothetical protein
MEHQIRPIGPDSPADPFEFIKYNALPPISLDGIVLQITTTADRKDPFSPRNGGNICAIKAHGRRIIRSGFS